jgi:hypothetical protein
VNLCNPIMGQPGSGGRLYAVSNPDGRQGAVHVHKQQRRLGDLTPPGLAKRGETSKQTSWKALREHDWMLVPPGPRPQVRPLKSGLTSL